MVSINKRGINQLVVVSFTIIVLIALGLLIFRWTSGTLIEETQKSVDGVEINRA